MPKIAYFQGKDDLVDKIAADIALGCTHEEACLVNDAPLLAWEHAVRKVNSYVARATKKANACLVKGYLGAIGTDSKLPTGKCWILERTRRDRFALKGDVTVNQQVNGFKPAEVQNIRTRAAAFVDKTTRGRGSADSPVEDKDKLGELR